MKLLIVLIAMMVGLSGAQAKELKITGISISSMKKANLCGRLGGRGSAPTITIRHSKIAGVPIHVRMFDRVSGRIINHHSTTVKSRKSGKTVVRYSFLPPCNTSGYSTSNYWVKATSGSSSKKKLWGRYNSSGRKIF